MHTHIKYVYFTCDKQVWNTSEMQAVTYNASRTYLQHFTCVLSDYTFIPKWLNKFFTHTEFYTDCPKKWGKKAWNSYSCFLFLFLNKNLKYNTHISIYILCWAVYGNTFGSNYIVKSFWVWCTLICGHFYECNMRSEVLWIRSGCTVKTELKYFLNALFKNILLEPIVFPIVILLVMTWENSVHVHWSK